MQLSLKLSALALLLAQAAAFVLHADDRITSSLSQENAFPLIANYEKIRSSSFSCEVDDPVVFQLNGPYARYRLNGLPPDSLFDARRATWESDIRRNWAAVHLSGGENICWVGGRILAYGARQDAEASNRPKNIGMVIKTAAFPTTVAVDGLTIGRTINGIDIRSRVETITLKNMEMFDLNGTCVRLGLFGVAAVHDSLFDGCGRFLSFSEQDVNNAHELILKNNMIRVYVDETVAGKYNPLFDAMQFEVVAFELYDNVILFEGNQETIDAYISDSMSEGVTGCANNVFILPEGTQYQLGNTDCGVITNDRAIWEEAKNAWMDRHLDDPSSSNLHSASPSGTPDDFIAGIRADAIEYVRSRVDGTGADRRFDALDANGAPDVVAEARRATEQAIAHAESTATAVASFLRSWADGTFWHDGTGWLE